MNRVVHFEIHAENPANAIQFYQKVFGWKFQSWGGSVEYWMIKTGEPEIPGINGGLVKRRGPIDGEAVIAYICTIEVESVDKTTKAVEKNGGRIVVPKMAIPGIGWLVYCKDNQGNIFGLMHNDPKAV
jgi:predicted enzyme related to lactoylglutathione lyase